MKRFRMADVAMPQRAGPRPNEAVREPARSAPSFDAARRTLHELLAPLNFVRVIAVSQAARGAAVPLQASSASFFGEGEEIQASHRDRDRAPPKRVFFSSFSRQSGLGFSVGGLCTLVDSPLGSAHASSMPQVGAVLVGSLVASTKAKARCGHELRGWCNHARPLLELHRIVQFGTRGGESETRMLVRQPAAESAAEYLRAVAGTSSALSGAQKRMCVAAAGVADELDCLARMVLYGSFEGLLATPAPRLGGMTPLQFVENASLVLRDSGLLREYVRVAPPPPPPPPTTYIELSASSGRGYPVYDHIAAAIQQSPYGAPHAAQSTTPIYAPRSPSYMPTSPPYVPGSPAAPTSPPYVPGSPAYAPTSPAYAPSPRGPDKPVVSSSPPMPAPASPPSPRRSTRAQPRAAQDSEESGEDEAAALLRRAIASSRVNDSDM